MGDEPVRTAGIAKDDNHPLLDGGGVDRLDGDKGARRVERIHARSRDHLQPPPHHPRGSQQRGQRGEDDKPEGADRD